MATKTEEEIAREAFKQELLHTSNWGLRQAATGPNGAGVDLARAKAAGEIGPNAMVDLIMDKYDEGWRPGGKALNPSAGKTARKTAKKEKAEKPADGNPWDDIGTDGPPLDIDGDSEQPAEEKTEPAPEPEPTKKKRQRRQTKAKPTETGELTALEEKVDKILDTLMKVASIIAKLEKAVGSVNENVEGALYSIDVVRELSVRAFGGLFNRLSIPGYKDVYDTATQIAERNREKD